MYHADVVVDVIFTREGGGEAAEIALDCLLDS